MSMPGIILMAGFCRRTAESVPRLSLSIMHKLSSPITSVLTTALPWQPRHCTAPCQPWARFPTGLQQPPHPASRLHGLIVGGMQVGFPRRDPVALQDALARTHKVLWIRNTKQTRWARKGQLIGFARATSDGVCAATIWDVAVRQPGHPGWPCTSHGLLSPGMGPQLDESLCVGPQVFWGETAPLMRALLDL